MPIQTCKWDGSKMITVADGGLDLAQRWFGLTEADIEAKLGRFTKGRYKGQVRGWIVYRKVTEGGWSFKLGGVLRPGMIFALFCESYDGAMNMISKPGDVFVALGKRVDLCYGHDPVKAREQAASQAKYFPLYYSCKQEIDKAAEMTLAIVSHLPQDQWEVVGPFDYNAHLVATRDHMAALCGVAQ